MIVFLLHLMDGKALLITGADMILETFFLLGFVQWLDTHFSLPGRNVIRLLNLNIFLFIK